MTKKSQWDGLPPEIGNFITGLIDNPMPMSVQMSVRFELLHLHAKFIVANAKCRLAQFLVSSEQSKINHTMLVTALPEPS